MFPPELPPVTNRALYVRRVFAKWLSFFVFGLNSLFAGLLVLPLMRLALHPKTRFQKYGRRFIHLALRIFAFFMHCVGMADIKTNDREKFKRLGSKIVVANHPSFIDPAILLSLIPNADTIVIQYRKNLFMGAIMSQLYVVGSKELDDIISSCAESLRLGNCMMIFPEGTRTPRYGKPILKKGAARIALASGCNIVPVRIGGTDKYGLGKKDPWAGYNPAERYVYDLAMGEEISPEKYRNLPGPAAAKLLTDEIASFLFPKKQTEKNLV